MAVTTGNDSTDDLEQKLDQLVERVESINKVTVEKAKRRDEYSQGDVSIQINKMTSPVRRHIERDFRINTAYPKGEDSMHIWLFEK